MTLDPADPTALRATAAALLGLERWTCDGTALVARARGCRIESLEGRSYLDLTAGAGALPFGAAHPAVTAAVQAAAERGLAPEHATAPGLEIAAALRDHFGGCDRVAPFDDHRQALRWAVEAARRTTGRQPVAVLGAGDDLPPPLVPLADAGAALPLADPLAAVLMPAATPRSAPLRAAAEAAGVGCILDHGGHPGWLLEAGGTERTSRDLVVLGRELAAGHPIGAVLGTGDTLAALGEAWRAPPLSLAAAAAVLALAADRSLAEGVLAGGRRLRRAFESAAAEQEIAARLIGPDSGMTIAFADQENAPGKRIHQAFVDELRAAGALGGRRLAASSAMGEADIATAEAAVRHAMARVRTLLIEHNSYISGGLRWVFGPGQPRLAERQLAIYRFPLHGPVDVTAQQDHVRIAFAAGDLGKVTSSGFYVPTHLRGDFTVTLRYRIERWQPGAHAACLALFAQDEASVLRYYSQRRSSGQGPHEVLGNFNNRDLTAPQPVEGDEGQFRIERRGDVVSASHRTPGEPEWTRLGEHDGDPCHDVVVGAKIWSSGPSGPLQATLHDLEVEAEIPDDQAPEIAVRPAPRRS